MKSLDELHAMLKEGIKDNPPNTGVWMVPQSDYYTLMKMKDDNNEYLVTGPSDWSCHYLFGRVTVFAHSIEEIRFQPYCSRCGEPLRIDTVYLCCMECGWRAEDETY